MSERDLGALRAQEATTRIQRLQLEDRLDDFAEAARRVWRANLPDGPPAPADPQAIIAGLAERESLPPDAGRQLAARRVSVTRTHLVEAAGIVRDRLVDDPGPPSVGGAGDGRVEFSLEPVS